MSLLQYVEIYNWFYEFAVRLFQHTGVILGYINGFYFFPNVINYPNEASVQFRNSLRQDSETLPHGSSHLCFYTL